MTRAPDGFTEAELQSYADGRLDPARRASIDADPEASARVRAYQDQNRALHELFDPVAEAPLPPALRVEAIRRRQRDARRRAWVQAAAAVVLVLAGGAAGWWAHGLRGEAVQVVLAREALSAHKIYVGEARHAVEVAAEQETHLVAWLSKRLAAPIKAPVLLEAGYALVGGRLLPSADGPAAQFMYEAAEGRRLTLFIRANPSSEVVAFRYVEEAGVGAFYWLEGPLAYAIIGTEPRARLLDLSRAVYRQLGS